MRKSNSYLLVSVGVTGPVWFTMINGKVVYADGHLTSVDEHALAEKGEDICTKVLRNEYKEYFYM